MDRTVCRPVPDTRHHTCTRALTVAHGLCTRLIHTCTRAHLNGIRTATSYPAPSSCTRKTYELEYSLRARVLRTSGSPTTGSRDQHAPGNRASYLAACLTICTRCGSFRSARKSPYKPPQRRAHNGQSTMNHTPATRTGTQSRDRRNLALATVSTDFVHCGHNKPQAQELQT